MQHLYERVAYLKGLTEGLEIEKSSKEGKVLAEIVDLLADFADELADLSDNLADVEEYVDAIDEDLTDIEDDFYELDDEEDDEDMGYVEIECPHCQQLVDIDEELLYDESEDIYCPNCHEIVIHAIDDEDDDCCCSEDCCECNK